MFNVTIRVENREKKVIRVTAIHTVDSVEDFRYSCIGLITTQAQRLAMVESIKKAYLEFLDKQVEDATFLAGLENTASNALNTWEGNL